MKSHLPNGFPFHAAAQAALREFHSAETLRYLMHLYIRVCTKDFGSLIWFVFQRSTQKKTCDQYRDGYTQDNAANKKSLPRMILPRSFHPCQPKFSPRDDSSPLISSLPVKILFQGCFSLAHFIPTDKNSLPEMILPRRFHPCR